MEYGECEYEGFCGCSHPIHNHPTGLTLSALQSGGQSWLVTGEPNERQRREENIMRQQTAVEHHQIAAATVTAVARTGAADGRHVAQLAAQQPAIERPWVQLAPDEHAAAVFLGYTPHGWDTGDEVQQRGWAQLTVQEQHAAHSLGFDEEIWQTLNGTDEADSDFEAQQQLQPTARSVSPSLLRLSLVQGSGRCVDARGGGHGSGDKALHEIICQTRWGPHCVEGKLCSVAVGHERYLPANESSGATGPMCESCFQEDEMVQSEMDGLAVRTE